MRNRSLRAWTRWLDDVHRALTAAGLPLDVFGFHDLQHLFRSKASPASVVERAKRFDEATR